MENFFGVIISKFENFSLENFICAEKPIKALPFIPQLDIIAEIDS